MYPPPPPAKGGVKDFRMRRGTTALIFEQVPLFSYAAFIWEKTILILYRQ